MWVDFNVCGHVLNACGCVRRDHSVCGRVVIDINAYGRVVSAFDVF